MSDIDDLFSTDSASPEQKTKALKEQRDAVETFFAHDRTYIILAAIHKDRTRNILNRIPCKKGISMQGYTYDAQADTYQIECSDYVLLGSIPVSMKIRFTGIKNWEVRVPLLESVVKRYLTAAQKKDVRTFKAVHKPEEFLLQYVQLIDPN